MPTRVKPIPLERHLLLRIADDMSIGLEQANMGADDLLRHPNQIRIRQVIKEAGQDMCQVVDAKIIGVRSAVGIRDDAVGIIPRGAIDSLDFKDILKQRLNTIV